jgi:hypothetical protein
MSILFDGVRFVLDSRFRRITCVKIYNSNLTKPSHDMVGAMLADI